MDLLKLGVVPLAALMAGCGGKARKGENRPNIIVIMADDLGYGDVSCYGAEEIQTPGIDRLAEEGLRLTNGHCTSATSTPSRFAMLTGMYPWRVGASILPGDAPMLIKEDMPTFPKMLKQAGYATGVVGKWHLGLGNGNLNWNEHITPSPNEVGFDYSYIMAATNDRVPTVYVRNGDVVDLDPDDPIEVNYRMNFPGEPTGKDNPELLRLHPSVGHNMSITNGIPRIGYMKGGKSALWVDEDMYSVFLEEAKNYVKKHKDEPFFLYYALHQPHVPRLPNIMFAGKSKLGARGDVILEADYCVEEFLKYLDELKLTENTIVIFTSDNGPVLDDGYKDMAEELNGVHRPAGPFAGWKCSPYEGGARIPMIIRWPEKVKAGTTSDALVCQLDFCPSFAALLEQPYEVKDGVNVLDALLGVAEEGRECLVLEGYGIDLWLKEGNWACIPEYTNRRGEVVGARLYDLETDIAQQYNLAEKYPERVKKMTEKLNGIKGY